MTATIVTVWLLIGQNQAYGQAPITIVAQTPTVQDCESLRTRVAPTFDRVRFRCFETRIVR